MAFFGGDGLEIQLNQLRKQLSSKDSELTSIRNEHSKTQAELVEAKRGRSDLEYKLEAEANRAHQAESSWAAKASELSNIRLQYENLQSSLSSANDKLKSSEKENERLQYPHGYRPVDDQSELKQLRQKLKAREEEISQLKTRSLPPKSPGGPLKKSSTAFFPPSFTPARSKSRRRSASFSSDPRVGSLEAELNSLRSAQEVELAKIRAQLDVARRDLDKVTNAKLALEKSSQKELESMRSELDDATYELEGWRRNGEGSSSAEVSRLKAKIKESQAESEGLQGKLELAHLEVDRLSATVTELQSRIEAPSSPDRSVRQYQREIKSLNSRIQSLEDELRVQDEEILNLKGAIPLPESPGRLQQLEANLEEQRQMANSRLEELEKVRKEFEVVNFGLQQERDAAKEEVQRLDDQVDALETCAANAEATVSSLQEQQSSTSAEHERDMLDMRGQVEALRTELADLNQRLRRAVEQADGMQEKYERCARQKLDLEKDLAELQAIMADRSTASEGQDRMAEIFDQKEEIQHLTAKLQGSERSLSLARMRITELEASIAVLTPLPSSCGSREVVLLQDKIQRLRSERDELRLSFSYVQHEHRFARDAAEADRISAVEDLQRARSELEVKLEAISTLRAEHAAAKDALDTVTTRLEGVNGSFASASAEKNDLADKVTHLEVDLREATSSRDQLLSRVDELDKRLAERLEDSQVQHLISEVAMAQHKASKAEREMFSLLKANKEYESRIDRLQEQLEATIEVRPASTDRPPSRADRPPSRADRPSSRGSIVGGGHIRRISQVYSGETVDTLRIEKTDLLGRVQNRENRIEAMKIEIRQLKANLQLAEEAAEEVGAEKLEVEKELEDLKAASFDGSDAQTTIRELVIALATHRQYISATQAGWKKQRQSLQAGNDTLDRISNDATNALTAATLEISSLSQSLYESKAEAQCLSELVEEREASLAQAIEGRNRAEAPLLEKQSEVDAGVADLQAADEEIAALSANLDKATVGTATDVDGLRSELQAQQDALAERTEQLTMARRQVDEATHRLASAEDQLAVSSSRVKEQDIEISRLQEKVMDLQEDAARLSAQVSDLKVQLDGKPEDVQKAELALELAVAEHERVAASQESEISELRGRLGAGAGPAAGLEEISDLVERIAELEAALTLRLQEVDEADDRVREAFKAKTKLEKKVAKLQRALAAASTDHETAANTAANKNIPVPASTPRSKSMSVLPVERTPLRSVNIFDTSQTQALTSPGQGIKRPREGEEGEKKMPPDCIVLQPSPGKAAVRKERAKSFGHRVKSVRSPVH